MRSGGITDEKNVDCSGTTVILFVFRILKALDFQPIMGVVTRTLWAASADMAHFVVLFSLSKMLF